MKAFKNSMIRSISGAVVLFLLVVSLAPAQENYPVTQKTYYLFGDFVKELSRYSRNVEDAISSSTASGGINEKSLLLKEVYDGLSIMICNLIGLKTALTLERMHGAYRQFSRETAVELKSYAIYVDMHHDIQIEKWSRRAMDETEDSIKDHLNHYLSFLKKAKGLITVIKSEIVV